MLPAASTIPKNLRQNIKRISAKKSLKNTLISGKLPLSSIKYKPQLQNKSKNIKLYNMNEVQNKDPRRDVPF
jgi:plasmid rolling circle replication initiator protein Rep